MKPSEIIAAEAKNRGLNVDKVFLYVNDLLSKKAATLVQKNNSVLLIKILDDNTAELHLFTQDNPTTLAKSLVFFIKTLRQTKFRAVYGMANNQQIIELLKRLDVDVMPSDKPEYNWMATI